MSRITFTYPARVVRVVDGDTVVLDVDLGFHVWLRDQSFRLLGVNARERSEPGGKEARLNLVELLPVNLNVVISSVRNDKYGGRYDATVRLPDDSDLGMTLIRTQWAAAWDGYGEKPIPPWPRTVA
jgi:micrococcal nuclease